MEYGELRRRILPGLRPAQKEIAALQTETAVLVAELEAALAYQKVDAQVFVGGSSVKGTGLRNNHDVDVFVRFLQEKNLSDALEDVVALLPDAYERVHGSRDYFQLRRGEILFEIVPVLNIADHRHAENVTDMSPLHVLYAQQRLTPRMKDDVRLAKQFCKANNIYGAESYINGFSGHVLELLIINYRSFQKLLRAAATWVEPVVIDIEGHHNDPLAKLNASKLHSPLVVVDPVQPERNAAAALSHESFAQFKTAAARFVKKPSLSAFRAPPFTEESIRKQHKGSLVIMRLQGKAGKRDVVGAKCLKAFEYLKNHLEGFTVVDADFRYDHDSLSALAFIAAKEKKLAQNYEQEGPPVHAKKGAESFRKKHQGKKIVERNKRLYVVQRRSFRTLRQKLHSLIKDVPVTSRATVKIL